MNRQFQRYIVHMEILSTYHARVEYISVKEIGPYATESNGS